MISIIEDDELVRVSLSRLLRSLGYTCDAFPSAVNFLASYRIEQTACLIADIHMPAMTGLELYERLIELGHRIPTILITGHLTGHPDEASRAQALGRGILYYLAKPFDDSELAGCVQKAIEGDRPAGSS